MMQKLIVNIFLVSMMGYGSLMSMDNDPRISSELQKIIEKVAKNLIEINNIDNELKKINPKTERAAHLETLRGIKEDENKRIVGSNLPKL